MTEYEELPPVRIPLCIPHLNGNEGEFLQECVESTFVSSVGPFVDRFERELAERTGADFAVAMTSGSAALHVALLLAGVVADDEVLVSDLSFIAPANAVRYVGAWPVFVDAESTYLQLDVDRLRGFLENGCRREGGQLRNRETGRQVRALLPVHVFGHPLDLDPIRELAAQYDLALIEDSCEGLGARYRGRPVGKPTDIACLSFNGNKIVTAGGGGALLTDDEERAARARYLSTQAKDDPIEYIHHEVGFNYRMTNIQAALGCAQLEHLDEHVAAKRRVAARYQRELEDIEGLTLMAEASWATSTSWLYVLRVDPAVTGRDRRILGEELGRKGIQTRPLWQPLHSSPAHEGQTAGGCTVSSELNRTALTIPCSVGLGEGEQGQVIAAIRMALGCGI